MIIITFLPSRDSQLDWTDAELREVFIKRLSILTKTFPESDVFLCTDSGDVAALAEQDGYNVIVHPGFSDDILSSLAPIVDDPALSNNTSVILLDARAPLIRIKDIERAVIMHKEEGKPVVTTTEVLDHPYHLKQIGLAHWTGFAPLWENKQQTVELFCKYNISQSIEVCSLALSRPFPLDWQTYLGRVPGKGEAFTIVNECLLSTSVCHADVNIFPLWIPLGERQCRVAFQPTVNGAAGFLLGASLPEYDAPGGKVTFHIKNDIVVFSLDLSLAPCTLHIFPVDSKGIVCTESSTVNIDPDGYGVWAVDPSDSWVGLAMVTTRDNGETNMTRPFNPGGVLWSGNKNIVTGQTISGRQSMPEVFTVKLLLVTVQCSEAKELECSILDGRFRPLIISEAKTLLLKDRLDLLRLKGFLRANGEPLDGQSLAPGTYTFESLSQCREDYRELSDTKPNSKSMGLNFFSSTILKNILHTTLGRDQKERDGLVDFYDLLNKAAAHRARSYYFENSKGPKTKPLTLLLTHEPGKQLIQPLILPDQTILISEYGTPGLFLIDPIGKLERVDVSIYSPIVGKDFYEGKIYLLSRDGMTLHILDQNLRHLARHSLPEAGISSALKIQVGSCGLTLLNQKENTVFITDSDLQLKKMFTLSHMDYLTRPVLFREGLLIINSPSISGPGELIFLKPDGIPHTVLDGLDMPLALDVAGNMAVCSDRHALFVLMFGSGLSPIRRTRIPHRLLFEPEVSNETLTFSFLSFTEDLLYLFVDYRVNNIVATTRSKIYCLPINELTALVNKNVLQV